jgi:TDG/mug DNA glycosylase family protein
VFPEGIAPQLLSRAGNRAGFCELSLFVEPVTRVPRLAPQEQHELASFGYGLTNAALRTTPGSGDLRRGDFADAAERLAAIAEELGPDWIAFVGKEAYRGAFGTRPELGEEERRLRQTRLFVLPSTSPANAAVPYAERLRWFRALRERLG